MTGLLTSLSVRPIRIRDIPAIRELHEVSVPLDVLQGWMDGVVNDALTAVPLARRSRRAFVVVRGDVVSGLIELRADAVNHRWQVEKLATSGTGEGDGPRDDRRDITTMLGEHAARMAGANGAKRVHAALGEESPFLEGLQSAGFEPFARETVYVSDSLDRSRSSHVRPQEPSDVWLIHQLYHLVAPLPVQYAEALTSSYWDVPRRARGGARGYVIEDGLELSAYCRVWSGAGKHVIRIMAQSNCLELIEPLVRDVAARAGISRGDTTLLFVPDYLQEYSTAVERAGFRAMARQARLVKYTTVPQRVRLRAAERASAPSTERIPVRTPTYFVWKNSSRNATRDISAHVSTISRSNTLCHNSAH